LRVTAGARAAPISPSDDPVFDDIAIDELHLDRR
jgi:hypothetical protein